MKTTLMELLQQFSQHLLTGKNPVSKLTVKNYLSDIRRFIRWYETAYKTTFSPAEISIYVLEHYRKELESAGRYVDQDGFMRDDPKISRPSLRSRERYFSSLRKFFSFLESSGTISSNPFDLLTQPPIEHTKPDPGHLRQFKDFLHRSNASALTVKNYLLDLEQFFAWFTVVAGPQEHYDLKERDLLRHLDRFLLEEYKRRLVSDAQASPSTINRKLSSLRRYVIWAESEGYVRKFSADSLPTNVNNRNEKPTPIPPIEIAPESHMPSIEELLPVAVAVEPEPLSEEKRTEPVRKPYSSLPPLRLIQRLSRGGLVLFDFGIVLPVFRSLETLSYITWKATGSRVFKSSEKNGISRIAKRMIVTLRLNEKIPEKKSLVIENLPKSFYAPLSMSVRHAPVHRKLWFHFRYTRPRWYRTYHSYKFVHYVHAAVLVLCMSAAGFGVVQAMNNTLAKPVAFASLPDGPPRIISFSGKLTRTDTSPITAKTILRFGMYNDPVASGSSQLWEEALTVTPDSNGNFNVLLGEFNPIPQRLFKDNARLYVGMSVETGPELRPRKEIPTEVLAATSETVQGLRPITDPAATEKNTLLALDSSGNLVIGGHANPSFIATGGSFTLSGQAVILTTEPDSNNDIILSPSGVGKIDFQKPIHNTSEYNTLQGISGAVEIADSLLINAEQSSQSALFINQNTNGPLISASAAGIAKFTLGNTGAATFGDSVTIEGDSLSTTQTSFNLLTTNPINLTIGTSASAVSLGASSGTLTINNAQTVIAGNLEVKGASGATLTNEKAGISFTGSGNHLITATAGSLELGGVTLTGNVRLNPNVAIVPTSSTGQNTLGSQTNPFDTLYVTDIVSPSLTGAAFWQNQGGLLSPAQTGASLGVGGTASSSAVWQVFASGASAGTASSSGNLTFTKQAADATINKLNGGSISFQLSTGGDAGLVEVGRVNNTGFVSVSSRRFKKDITAVNDPLGKIGRLQGVYYTWDEAHGGQQGLGFIAEEVGQVVPEVVEWEEDGVNAKGISYGNLTALAIEGIKAQQNQIARLESTVNQLILTNDRNYHILAADGAFLAVAEETNEPATLRAAFADAVIGTMESGLTLADTIRTATLTASTAMITGLSVEQLTTEYIDAQNLNVTSEFTAKNGTILSLRTDEISGTASDAALSLSLGATALTISSLGDGERHQVASIDTLGNATFAGIIRARDGAFAGLIKTASLSAEAEVRTKKLIAEELELSDNGLIQLMERLNQTPGMKTLASSLQTLRTLDETETTPPSLTPLPPAASSSGMIPSPTPTLKPQIITEYDDLSSSSAILSLVVPESQTASSAASLNESQNGAPTIASAIPAGSSMVLSDLSVADTITVNGNFILSETSLDVIGADVQIQPLRGGGVSFLSGLVGIDPGGNLTVSGNAHFAGDVTVRGKLAASVLSPVDSQNLIVSLDDEGKQSLVVTDATSEAKLTIKGSGDVESSGQGSFSSLLSKSLQIVRGNQADASLIETIANASAGTATIMPGQTQRTVITPFVTEQTLVYITPVSDTQGVVPYISRQTAADPTRELNGSFTIQITQKVSKPIRINWWVVN